jgi:hypothetical protein
VIDMRVFFKMCLWTLPLLSAAACVDPVPEGDGQPRTGSGPAIRITVTYPMADVGAARITAIRTSCSGERFEPFSTSVLAFWSPREIAADGTIDEPTINAFVPLDTGCYDLVVQPITGEGAPSEQCSIAGVWDIVVFEGLPTEVILVSQCKAAEKLGALDLVSILDGPRANYRGDVLGVNFSVERVSCNGESAPTFKKVYSGILSTLGIEDPTGEEPRRFVDMFLPLPGGCYDVVAQPTSERGQASSDCAAARAESVVLLDGKPTEAILRHPCDSD